MQLKVFIILIGLLYFEPAELYSDWGIKRYDTVDIAEIYESSRFYFDRGEYNRAARVLKDIQNHQNPVVKNHIAALGVLSNWSSSWLKEHINALIRLGVDQDLLYESACLFSIENHQYNMYEFCYLNHENFIQLINNQIQSMLLNYYSHADKPFHTFQRLSKLVNEDELSGDLFDDENLIRERIRAVLEEKNCEKKPSDCTLYSSSVASTVRSYIYSLK